MPDPQSIRLAMDQKSGLCPSLYSNEELYFSLLNFGGYTVTFEVEQQSQSTMLFLAYHRLR